MSTTEKIEKLVQRLAVEEENRERENFYKNENQQHNLKVYLSEMAVMKPKALLIGEAPGYLGCARTGVPFTDERVIRECNILPGRERYITPGGQKERTARAMWDALARAEALPLLWNAFPLHPHEKDKPGSNRAPNKAEINIGKKYICDIVEIFEIKKIYAVGMKAFNALSSLNIDGFIPEKNKSYIRHPSYGGKGEFEEQIEKYLRCAE